MRPSINFTKEVEEDSQLLFLDVLVKSQLSTTVCSKKTHIDRNNHFTSNHHPKMKKEVIESLKTGAARIYDEEHIGVEVRHLQTVFEKNGDPKGIINRVLKKKLTPDDNGPPTWRQDQPLKIRITEHKRAVDQSDMKNAYAVHSEVIKHEINWEDSTVVDREMRVMERKIKESIHIKRIRSYNLYSGYPLSPVWDSIIRDIQ